MKRYIKGRYAQAACRLIDHLASVGVAAAVGYYGSQNRGHGCRLIVQVTAGDVGRIPAVWEEMKVVVEGPQQVPAKPVLVKG